MRYIKHSTAPPNNEWVQNAQSLLQDLIAANDVAARNVIIDANALVWGELKQWLLILSHQKCWFSEAKDCFNHWDVEHYRPKKSAKDEDGTIHTGYWWLAFDWRNFRVCGNVGNRKKGTFFPVRPGSARVAFNGDIRLENPELLDPADPDDPLLLSFNVEGRAIPAAHVKDEWDMKRVSYSIDRYKLDFGPLEDRRKTIWAECWHRIEEYRNELALYYGDQSNMVARDRSKQAMKSLIEMIQANMELSTVARACIVSSGDERVISVLQAA